MSEQITTGIQNSRPSALTLIVIAVSTIILASCGGGGSDSTSSAESADSTKQALAVSGTATTVPGGWAGRTPKMEVINGITVPPEPAPAINNATLAGVDVNANGVRDDVERNIAKGIIQLADFDSALKFARAYQTMISIPTPSVEAIGTLVKSAACADIKIKGAFNGQSIKPLVANTEARKKYFRTLLSSYGGQMIMNSDCQ